MNMACALTYLCLLQFLSSVSYNFLSMSFTSLVRFIPRYFIHFEATLIGIVNATDFWILILHSATLLNSFIRSNGFLVKSLGFSMYSITSSANKSFASSFQIWMFFISSSCLIAVARTSSAMLN